MKVLFVDGKEERHRTFKRVHSVAYEEIQYALTYEEFEEKINLNSYDLIYLDYSMGRSDKNGLDCAKVLIDKYTSNPNKPKVIVHSLSNPQNKDMQALLISFGFEVKLILFHELHDLVDQESYDKNKKH